jgi:hypothetical protein
MNVKIVWLDGKMAEFKNIDSAGLDSEGRNVLVRQQKGIGGSPTITNVIPLTNVREVQYS